MGRPRHPPDANEYPNHINWGTRWRIPHFRDLSLGLACLTAIENERLRIGIDVFAYALMPDHFHLVIGPCDLQIGQVVQALKHASVHRLMADGLSTGGLWQPSYFDKALREERQLRAAIDYVHNNPVKAGLVERATDYELSSFRDWEEGVQGPILLARQELSLL